MNHRSLRFLYFSLIFFLIILLSSRATPLWAQFSESTLKANGLLFHGIEQYEQGHYNLAGATLKKYLNKPQQGIYNNPTTQTNVAIQKAQYYYFLSQIKEQNIYEINQAETHLITIQNPNYKSHLALELGKYYFEKGDLKKAIQYYREANIIYLNNAEIADKKFELAYCYFNNQQFDQATPLFAAIKDLPNNKYYIPGNYYFGLLAYNNHNYKEALKSFRRIDQEPTYSDVVPYYEAEICYFTGRQDEVLEISKKYLQKDSLYYTKDMVLLTAQTLFEQKKYDEALPYFERYYNHSDKIRKEELYELAYCYYRLKKWQNAIEKFQPLSNSKDSLGQTAMYLLGDCYLKINDKKGARNAFELCSELNFNPSQTEAADFLYAKLSDELGYESTATQKLNSFLASYPNSNFSPEAKTLLTRLLAKINNYADAFKIMSNLPTKDENEWRLFQRVAVGHAFQLLQSNQLTTADSVLNLSLQQPVSAAYEAVAYFWKSEIAYREKDYQQAINYGNTFLKKYPGDRTEIKFISQAASVQNAQMVIGYAQMELGDYQNAQQAFAEAKSADKDNPKANAIAALQEADAFFMQQNLPQAKKMYEDAIANGVERSDYARFQIALIDGLNKDFDDKNEILNELINKNPASPFRSKAQYELSSEQLVLGKTEPAINGFKTLVNSQAASEAIKEKALLKLAYAYQLNDDTENAINNYQELIKRYPADTNRSIALEALKNMYVANGTPEKYVTFLKENDLPNSDEATIENAFYDAAIEDFSKENWAKSIDGFNKYLNRFPNGKNAVKAHFYRGIANEKSNKDTLALPDFDTVLNAGWSDFSEDAASIAAGIAFRQGNFEKAFQYYKTLRSTTKDKQNLQTAYEGLMKCSFALKNFGQTDSLADTLLTLPELPENITAESRLYKAHALQNLNQYDSADSIYRELDKENVGAFSAEARYRIAQISFEKGDLKNAEKQAGYAVQASAGQDFWIVKCYILLGDILTQEKDYFNAKATLSSVVKNTKIPALKKEAAEKLEKVKALEEENSKLK